MVLHTRVEVNIQSRVPGSSFPWRMRSVPALGRRRLGPAHPAATAAGVRAAIYLSAFRRVMRAMRRECHSRGSMRQYRLAFPRMDTGTETSVPVPSSMGP